MIHRGEEKMCASDRNSQHGCTKRCLPQSSVVGEDAHDWWLEPGSEIAGGRRKWAKLVGLAGDQRRCKAECIWCRGRCTYKVHAELSKGMGLFSWLCFCLAQIKLRYSLAQSLQSSSSCNAHINYSFNATVILANNIVTVWNSGYEEIRGISFL